MKKAKSFSKPPRLFDAARHAADYQGFFSFKESFPFYFLSKFILLSFFLLAGCAKKDLSRPAPQMNALADFEVRVLLLRNTDKINLRINSAWTIIKDQDNLPLSLFGPTPSGLDISFDNGSFIVGESGERSRNQNNFPCTQLTITPQHPYIFNLNGNDYRGKLMLRATARQEPISNSNSNSFEVINVVPLEAYLAGVVGSEMPSYWEPAALEAQAVCSRTYCLYIKRHFGSSRNWDITATQANQVYLGVGAETKSVWKAVNKTKGQVLLCRQAGNRFDIFPAFFCSSCGGFTENSQAVFGGDYFEALQPVICPYCRLASYPDFFLWGNLSFDKSDVCRLLIQKYPALENLGTIIDIIPTRKTSFQIKNGKNILTLSRLTLLKLVGSNGGTSVIRAEDFRLTIDPSGTIFKSTVCKIQDSNDKLLVTDGRGFGHGCGLCQCGTQALARFESKTAAQILSYYYPNSQIGYVY